MLLYKEYIDRALQTEFRLPECAIAAIESVTPLLQGIFFVPTKRRLYDGLIEPRSESPLGQAHWSALQELGQRLDIPVHDLTPAMRADAETALAESDSLLFWKDDTHWNGLGTASAAREVATVIGAYGTE